jgi:hypothetical protein
MRAVGTIALSIAACLRVAQADGAESPRGALENAFRESTFALLYRRAELPPSLANYFISRALQASAPLAELLAEPGEDFNPYCVVRHGVPPSRLVFAGSSPSVAFALFERGGRSHYLSAVLVGSGEFGGRLCMYSLPPSGGPTRYPYSAPESKRSLNCLSPRHLRSRSRRSTWRLCPARRWPKNGARDPDVAASAGDVDSGHPRP